MSAPSAPRPEEDRVPAHAIVQRWLIGLRWVAFALLALTLPVGEHLFGFHVQYELALPVVALAAGVNVLASRVLARQRGKKPAGPGVAAAFVAFDLVAIGIVLAASGGAANPFSALFLVHVALAAAVLPAAVTFALSGLAALVFAALFAVPAGSCCAAHARDGSFSAHLYGMWGAFVMCAGLVAFFVTRIRRALDAREREILRLRREAEHAARFTALGTFAAGTAHELGTPLGTIAVLAGELTDGELPAAEARSHAKAIAQAVARCRDVLSRMTAAAHTSPAETSPLDVAEAAARAAAEFRAARPDVTIELALEPGLFAPITAEDFTSALDVLLDNAAFASDKASSAEPIRVRVAPSEGRVQVVVEDGGTGIPERMIERLGEPFLTTKEPGQGMGLGLYLVRGLLEPIGGVLRVANRRPGGARVELDLPRVAAPAASEPEWAHAAE